MPLINSASIGLCGIETTVYQPGQLHTRKLQSDYVELKQLRVRGQIIESVLLQSDYVELKRYYGSEADLDGLSFNRTMWN